MKHLANEHSFPETAIEVCILPIIKAKKRDYRPT